MTDKSQHANIHEGDRTVTCGNGAVKAAEMVSATDGSAEARRTVAQADIVQGLRNVATCLRKHEPASSDAVLDAADEIERLRGENAELRDCLGAGVTVEELRAAVKAWNSKADTPSEVPAPAAVVSLFQRNEEARRG